MPSTIFSKPFPLKAGDMLNSSTSSYRIMAFNGEGCFGKVAKCRDIDNGNMVAIKIFKNKEDSTVESEVAMLKEVRALDPDKKNIVEFIEYFIFNDLSCLAFEMLDKSLWDLMKERDWKGLSLNEIRPVTHQLLVALEALNKIGIMHTDLKPDNIMLVNHQNQPFKIKLIDFGLALPVDKAEVGMLMQACAYRAPEVILGLPLSESVDMWGLGCVMVFLYFGLSLFPADCEYRSLKLMLQLLGDLDGCLLNFGVFTSKYFIQDQDEEWRLKTPQEYAETNCLVTRSKKLHFESAENIVDLIMSFKQRKSDAEWKDRIEFLDLIASCLCLYGNQRITPMEALKCNFVSMAHLAYMEEYTYVDSAFDLMIISVELSDESEDGRSCKESDLPSVSHSAGEIQIMDCSSTDSDSSRIGASLNEDSKQPEDEEDCDDDMDPNKSPGPAKQADLYDIVRDRATPPREDPDPIASHNNVHTVVNYLPIGSNDRPSSDIVQNGGVAASAPTSSRAAVFISSNDGTTAFTSSNNGTAASISSNNATPSSISSNNATPSSISSNNGTTTSISTNDETTSSISSNNATPSSISSNNGTATSISTNDETTSSISSNDLTANHIFCSQGTTSSVSSSNGNTNSISSNDSTTNYISCHDGTSIGSEDADNIKSVPLRVHLEKILRRIGHFFRRVGKLFCCV